MHLFVWVFKHCRFCAVLCVQLVGSTTCTGVLAFPLIRPGNASDRLGSQPGCNSSLPFVTTLAYIYFGLKVIAYKCSNCVCEQKPGSDYIQTQSASLKLVYAFNSMTCSQFVQSTMQRCLHWCKKAGSNQPTHNASAKHFHHVQEPGHKTLLNPQDIQDHPTVRCATKHHTCTLTDSHPYIWRCIHDANKQYICFKFALYNAEIIVDSPVE